MWSILWIRLDTVVTIQIVLEPDLLKEANKAAKRKKINRSALIRDALREHLNQERIRELERQEELAYQRIPDDPKEFEPWLKVQVWPED